MPDINFDTFLSFKAELEKNGDSIAWQKVVTWAKGVGAIKHMVWKCFSVRGGRVALVPSYFAYVSVNDDDGTVSIALAANIRGDPQGRGQKVVDQYVVGKQGEINDQMLVDALHQRYGLNEVDFTKTPVSELGGKGFSKTDVVNRIVMRRKMMANKADDNLASLILRKLVLADGTQQYRTEAIVVPGRRGLKAYAERHNVFPTRKSIKDANADFEHATRELAGIGFVETAIAPDWANSSNWDYEIGLPLGEANKIRDAFKSVVTDYESGQFGTAGTDDTDVLFNDTFASAVGRLRTAQDVSQYYNGPLPSAAALQQYVGGPSLDASQIKSIFGGVDEALSMVNQFDSSLLRDVAFIYNFSGGGAYGVYMSALDEKIKNEELKGMLEKSGYAVQDSPDGSFYASHPQKNQQQIDQEIKGFRDKIAHSGATTFGIDMNKVMNAARMDCQEGDITDPQDQYMIGVMHLGATMAHEAVHSRGSTSEGPSEATESKFMQWALPVINRKRQDRFKSQGKEQEFAPLIVDPNKRRMARSFNWLERAAADGHIEVKAQLSGVMDIDMTKNLIRLEDGGETLVAVPVDTGGFYGPMAWLHNGYWYHKSDQNEAAHESIYTRGKRVGHEQDDLPPSTGTRAIWPPNPTNKTSTSIGNVKTAQYGAQFLQNFMANTPPPAWALWTSTTGPIESLLDRARPPRGPASKLSFEGQLRQQNQDKWTSSIDTGSSTEALLDGMRSPLQAYRSTEKLMEDGRDKPLMLPVQKHKRMPKMASKDSPDCGWMGNLDIDMADRVQRFDENDEDTTWFDSRFIRNQSRYHPEYGNPMSKEKDIYYWFKDPRLEITQWDDYMNEHPGLRTTPFQKAASVDAGDCARVLLSLLHVAVVAIASGKIRGTRFVCPDPTVPLLLRFCENEIDMRPDAYELGDGSSAVWLCSKTIPSAAVERAEAYCSGEDDGDQARRTFDYITGFSRVKTDAISTMLEVVGDAARQSGVKMLAVGDLPLCVAIGADKVDVRTVDFCCQDPDACLKIGEIVCERIGCISYHDDAAGMLVAKWGCGTFRFRGHGTTDGVAAQVDVEDENPLTTAVASHGVTALMLAFDVVTEEVVDPLGCAMPDVEAKVVRSQGDPMAALKANPLCIFDAIFLASKHGFAIDSGFAEAAKAGETSDASMAACWAVIRAVGAGKAVATAEEYGVRGLLPDNIGGQTCLCH